jgi:hypothetical protein
VKIQRRAKAIEQMLLEWHLDAPDVQAHSISLDLRNTILVISKRAEISHSQGQQPTSWMATRARKR